MAEKSTKWPTPACAAPWASRRVAIALSSSSEPPGWSRIEAARCTTVSTPRRAWRKEPGSPRSPSAICTRTRSGPRRRGSRTRQRTGRPAAVSRRRSALPTVPVAPVSRIIGVAPPWRRRSIRRCLESPFPESRHRVEKELHGLRHRRALHRHQGQLVRRGVPGGLHPPDARRARLRQGRAAVHRPRGVHRLRRVRRGLPRRRMLRRGPAPGRVELVHPDQRGVLQQDLIRARPIGGQGLTPAGPPRLPLRTQPLVEGRRTMQLSRWAAPLTVLACLAFAAPASAGGAGHGAGSPGSAPRPESDQGAQPGTASGSGTSTVPSAGGGGAGADVPSRIQSRLRRAERALSRLEGRVDDGDGSGAASAASSVQRNLAGALKSAERRADTDSGPASLGAVAAAQHAAVVQVAGLFDGVTDNTVISALEATMDGAISGRDDLIATIDGLAAQRKSTYGDVLSSIGSDVDGELSDLNEALTDDTLRDPEARDAVNGAISALTATKAKVAGMGVSSTSTATGTATGSTTATGTSAQTTAGTTGDRDCPRPDGTRQTTGAQA